MTMLIVARALKRSRLRNSHQVTRRPKRKHSILLVA